MAKKTETIVKIEREYVIPLRPKFQKVPRYKRTAKAIKTIKEFIAKHMKIKDRNLKNVRLDSYLNETVWLRGIQNPPHKIKVKAIKEGEIVRVYAVDLPNNIKFKKIREEKIDSKAKDAVSKKKAAKVPVEAPKTEAQKAEEAEKKEDEKEKKAAVVETGLEMEKAAAKKMKHERIDNVKEPKHQRRMALQK
ncbi:MAG TPA: 50S ribosomal protein L31e [Candidatus Nanoarchaeia archaeon]|nr:50S ribosomal protein L31e [Candidatus Nanoarchaeia archaeon]